MNERLGGQSFEEVCNGLIRRQAIERVALTSQGLYETKGAEQRERHLGEMVTLLLGFPEESVALTQLGRIASKADGALLILETLTDPASAPSESDTGPIRPQDY